MCTETAPGYLKFQGKAGGELRTWDRRGFALETEFGRRITLQSNRSRSPRDCEFKIDEKGI